MGEQTRADRGASSSFSYSLETPENSFEIGEPDGTTHSLPLYGFLDVSFGPAHGGDDLRELTLTKLSAFFW